jgi:DNA primase
MIEPHLEFKRLKAMVSIELVLAHCGLDAHMRTTGNRLVGPCPVHGGDNPRAFVVNRESNTWYCFTRCSAGGDVVELVRRLKHCDYADAARHLAALVGRSAPRPPPSTLASTRADFRPFTRLLPLDPDHRFLAHKGIRPATARRFQAGIYHGPGFLQGCAAVRIHDTNGRPLGYAGRRLDSRLTAQFGKWKLPPRLPKSRLLYNFHRVAHNCSYGIVIVEGPWDVMRLQQLHVPAVALLGTAISSHHIRLIRAIPTVSLLLDGDAAGRTAAARIRHLLPNATDVHVIHLPDGIDPDDLSDKKLAQCTQPFFSF